jgi:branched-chain amino acid transport system permease protein
MEQFVGWMLYLTGLLTFAGIFGVSALGLNLNWGMSGLFNAGIAGFFAVGAYTTALLTADPAPGRWGGFELPMPLGCLAATVIAGLIALPIGLICLRLRSDYLAIATIGIAEILRQIAKNEIGLTGGTLGIKDIPRPFVELGQPWAELAFLGIVVAIVGVIYWAMERARVSPWGRVMRAIRDNETAAAAMGKDVERFRLQAFVIGSAFMGLGGALTAHYLRVLTPEAAEPLIATFLVWVMLIAGGSGNNKGALLGCVIVWFLWTGTELVSGMMPTEWGVRIGYLRVMLVGLLLQVVLQRFPGGLMPERAPIVADAPPPKT